MFSAENENAPSANSASANASSSSHDTATSSTLNGSYNNALLWSPCGRDPGRPTSSPNDVYGNPNATPTVGNNNDTFHDAMEQQQEQDEFSNGGSYYSEGEEDSTSPHNVPAAAADVVVATTTNTSNEANQSSTAGEGSFWSSWMGGTNSTFAASVTDAPIADSALNQVPSVRWLSDGDDGWIRVSPMVRRRRSFPDRELRVDAMMQTSRIPRRRIAPRAQTQSVGEQQRRRPFPTRAERLLSGRETSAPYRFRDRVEYQAPVVDSTRSEESLTGPRDQSPPHRLPERQEELLRQLFQPSITMDRRDLALPQASSSQTNINPAARQAPPSNPSTAANFAEIVAGSLENLQAQFDQTNVRVDEPVTIRRTFPRTPDRSAGTERVGGSTVVVRHGLQGRQRVVHRVSVPRGARIMIHRPPQQQPLDPRLLVPVSELQPQVLPEAEQQHHHMPDDEHLERFKCAICYDFLDQPVSCGTCSGRFCQTCLQQVLQPQLPTHSNVQVTAKCPTCRASFSTGIPDPTLVSDMAAFSVPCRYAGCTSYDGQQTMIRLSMFKLHEADFCAAVRVACRYAAYGCEWKGYRSGVEEHESSDCVLAKISGLLEQLRVSKADHHRDMGQLQRNIASLLTVLRAMDRGVQEAVVYDRANPFHLVSFVAAALLTTPRGLLCNKVPWKQMYQTADGRATVFNTLAMVPTMLLIVKIILEGVRYHSREWTYNKVVLLFLGWSPFFATTATAGANIAAAASDEIDAVHDLLDDLLMLWYVCVQ
jgi:hypothetical protein